MLRIAVVGPQKGGEFLNKKCHSLSQSRQLFCDRLACCPLCRRRSKLVFFYSVLSRVNSYTTHTNLPPQGDCLLNDSERRSNSGHTDGAKFSKTPPGYMLDPPSYVPHPPPSMLHSPPSVLHDPLHVHCFSAPSLRTLIINSVSKGSFSPSQQNR